MCPALSAWVEYCYCAGGHLWWNGDLACHSLAGVQQGDPLGPFLFALPLHVLVRRISSEFPRALLNAWYLDDGAVVLPRSDAPRLLQLIHDVGPSLGLELNSSKTSC